MKSLEGFKPFWDMRLMPTPAWTALAQKEAAHPLIRFTYIESLYGLPQHRARKMGPAAAIAHFNKRLAEAKSKIS
jgi:hypothetical protein